MSGTNHDDTSNERPKAIHRPDILGPHKGGLRFDATVNISHVFTILAALFAGFAAWTNMDKRVLVLEEYRATQSLIDKAQDERTVQTARELKELVGKVEKQLDRLNDKLDGKRP